MIIILNKEIGCFKFFRCNKDTAFRISVFILPTYNVNNSLIIQHKKENISYLLSGKNMNKIVLFYPLLSSFKKESTEKELKINLKI